MNMNCYNPQYSDMMDFRRQDSMSDMSSWYMEQGYPSCGMPPRMIQPMNETNAQPSGRAPWQPAVTDSVPSDTGNMPDRMGSMPQEQNNMPFSEKLNRFPIGMGYVPMQKWSQPSPIDEGFCRGTIFSELDLPFMMGRCM